MTTVWLVIAVMGLLIAGYFMVKDGWREGSVYLIFPLLAGMMYGLRKFMMGRMERHNDSEH